MKNFIITSTILIFINFFSALGQKSISVDITLTNQINLLKQQNDSLSKRLELIEINDSLSKRLDRIEKDDYKSISVIEKVNDFYDKSWNRLIIFLSIAGSIILFVLPYLLAKNQEEKINLKTKEFEELTNKKIGDLESKIAKFHNDQFELLKKEIGLTQSDLSKNLEDEIQFVQAYIFALRGMISEKDKNYDLFFKHYIISANKFISINKTSEIKNMVEAIIQRIDTCLSKNIQINQETRNRFDTLIETLEKNYLEVFPEIIESLKNNSSKLTVK